MSSNKTKSFHQREEVMETYRLEIFMTGFTKKKSGTLRKRTLLTQQKKKKSWKNAHFSLIQTNLDFNLVEVESVQWDPRNNRVNQMKNSKISELLSSLCRISQTTMKEQQGKRKTLLRKRSLNIASTLSQRYLPNSIEA